MVVYGTSIRSLQRLGWRQIDILAEENVRCSPAWRCALIGGVLERECDSLFLNGLHPEKMLVECEAPITPRLIPQCRLPKNNVR